MHLFSILGAALASLVQFQPTALTEEHHSEDKLNPSKLYSQNLELSSRDIELRYLERFSDYSLFHRLGGSHNIDDHSID